HLLRGKTLAVDATTLEANAAMRSIVRRDTGESYQKFLTRLAVASGLKTPRREALARLDRRRKKRTSNTEWVNPSDPDAKVTQLKDGRTHLAHKVEHAVDLETGALVAVTLHGADVGDTTSLLATTLTAAEQLGAVQGLLARASEHPQAADRPRGRVQSRTPDAACVRARDATGPSGPPAAVCCAVVDSVLAPRRVPNDLGEMHRSHELYLVAESHPSLSPQPARRDDFHHGLLGDGSRLFLSLRNGLPARVRDVEHHSLVHLPLAPGPVRLAELELLELAGGCAGERVAQLDRRRALVVRHARATERDQVGRTRLRARPQHHQRLDGLPTSRRAHRSRRPRPRRGAGRGSPRP